MNAQLAAHGRLGKDPMQHTTEAGKVWATCSLAVTLDTGKDREPETEWIGLVAFGRQAEALLRHKRGDMVSVFGRLQLNVWAGQDGGERRQLQIVVDSLLSACTVRPRGGKRVGPGSPGQPPQASYAVPPPVEFNDEIAF